MNESMEYNRIYEDIANIKQRPSDVQLNASKDNSYIFWLEPVLYKNEGMGKTR